MLVALAIVGLVLVATARVFGAGVMIHQAAGGSDIALTIAEDKLAAAGADDKWRPGSEEGVYAGRFRWRVTIAPYADPQTRDLPQPRYRLYRIVAEVAWREGWRERHARLQTLRLGPAPR